MKSEQFKTCSGLLSADAAGTDVPRVGAGDGRSTLNARPTGADRLPPVLRGAPATDVDAPALVLRVVGVVVDLRIGGRAARGPAVRAVLDIHPDAHDVARGAAGLAARGVGRSSADHGSRNGECRNREPGRDLPLECGHEHHPLVTDLDALCTKVTLIVAEQYSSANRITSILRACLELGYVSHSQ